MGRKTPLDESFLVHPVLSFLVLAIGMAAAIAMITGLCGVRSRKKSSTSSSAAEDKSVAFNPPSTLPNVAAENAQTENATEKADPVIKELPLPPAMKLMGETSPNNQISKCMSERKLKINMSMKVPRSLSVSRHGDQKDDNGRHKKGKIKADDSVWMKTIILGEKCKVANEDEAVIYEGQGKKISAYHPRTASSISFSRQSSFIDPDAITIPSQTPTRIEKS